ncbi:hypothetical protein AT245_07200 [Bartonella henselae]|nr:hypothetical protein AT245_07200 [Bartonella henselae]
MLIFATPLQVSVNKEHKKSKILEIVLFWIQKHNEFLPQKTETALKRIRLKKLSYTKSDNTQHNRSVYANHSSLIEFSRKIPSQLPSKTSEKINEIKILATSITIG